MRKALILVLLVITGKTSVAAQTSSATVVDSLKKTMGAALTRTLQVRAGGSEYVAASDDAALRVHTRIQGFAQELDLAAPHLSERYLRIDIRPDAAEPTHEETRVAAPESPWAGQYALWTTPYGFIAGLMSRPSRVTTELLFGRTYHVVTLSAAPGREVRGYINESGVLERTRTDFERAGSKVQLEAIYLDWTDFDGVRYPTVVIEKENNELSRILVVDKVTQVSLSPRTAWLRRWQFTCLGNFGFSSAVMKSATRSGRAGRRGC